MKKAKKLNLYEMWDLYLLVGNSDGNEFLIDEVYSLLGRIPRISFIQIMQLLYKDVEFDKYNPVEIVLMLIGGLQKNNAIIFQEFVKGLSRGNSIR